MAVKVGSNVLTRADGKLDVTRMSAIVDQIAELRKRGIEVLLITSGAVASGRGELPSLQNDGVAERQLYAAVGQAKLIEHYYELFKKHGIIVGQILTSRENFEKNCLLINQKRCMTAMLDNGVVPIINENDALAIKELMFTDNDELSGLVAKMMRVKALIILSNVDGVFTGDPENSDSELIRKVYTDDDFSYYIGNRKSEFGRGGMGTKMKTAQKVAKGGIIVYIANGKKSDILLDLLFQPEKCDFTLFLSNKKPKAK